MSLAIQALIVGLAAWRISAFFVLEVGPFSIPEKIREKVGIETNTAGLTTIKDSFLAGVFSCVWCFSVWVVVALWFLYNWHAEPVAVIAAMGIAVIVNRIVDR